MQISNKVKIWLFSLLFLIPVISIILYKLIYPEEIPSFVDSLFSGFWVSAVINYIILLFSSILYASTGEINLPIKERKNSILSMILIAGSTISILKDTAFSSGLSKCSVLLILILLLIPYLIIISAMITSFFKEIKELIVSKVKRKSTKK